jgi:hypothetical protein
LPLIPAIRDTVAQLDSNLPVFGIKTQSEQIERSLFQERMLARLSSFSEGFHSYSQGSGSLVCSLTK